MLLLIYVSLLVAFGIIFYTSESLVPGGVPQKLLSFYAPPTIAPAPILTTWISSLCFHEDLVIENYNRIIISFMLKHTSVLCTLIFTSVTISAFVLAYLVYSQRLVNRMLESAIYEDRRFLEHILEQVNSATAPTSESTVLPCTPSIESSNTVTKSPHGSMIPERIPQAMVHTPSSPQLSNRIKLAPSPRINTSGELYPIPSLVLIPSTTENEPSLVPEAELTHFNLSSTVSDYSNLMELALGFPSSTSSLTSDFADQPPILELLSTLKLPCVNQSLPAEGNTEPSREARIDPVPISADSTAETISVDKSKQAKFQCDTSETQHDDTTQIILDDTTGPSHIDVENDLHSSDSRYQSLERLSNPPSAENAAECNTAFELVCSSAKKSTST
jgi:hypothetical protein